MSRKKKPGRPRAIVLPGGEQLELRVMRIEDRHPDGTPRTLHLMLEEETTDLRTQSNAFLLGYISAKMIGAPR